MSKYQNDATALFAARVAEIRAIAEKLIEQCDDHFGLSPDDVTWGNAGDAGRVLEVLRELNIKL